MFHNQMATLSPYPSPSSAFRTFSGEENKEPVTPSLVLAQRPESPRVKRLSEMFRPEYLGQSWPPSVSMPSTSKELLMDSFGPSSKSSNPRQLSIASVNPKSHPVPSELEIRESAVQPGKNGIWSRTRLLVGRKFGPISKVSSNLTLKECDVRKMTSWACHIRVQPENENSSISNLAAVYSENLVYFVVIRPLDIGEELILIYSDVIFTENELNGLLNKVEPPENNCCEQCEENFESTDELGKHKCKAQQESPEDPDTPSTAYECPVCLVKYEDAQSLEDHCLSTHSGYDLDQTNRQEFYCPKCHKRFHWKSNLQRHLQHHEEGKTYNCEHCSKVFTDPSNLQRHVRSQHVGSRSHACEVCGKTFATSSGLKQHAHIHSSVKPFQCEVCQKAYTQFSNLCRHKRMHASCRMQVKCNKCFQSFTTATALTKHRRFCEGASPSLQSTPFNHQSSPSLPNFTVPGPSVNTNSLANGTSMSIGGQQNSAGGAANNPTDPFAFIRPPFNTIYPAFYNPALFSHPSLNTTLQNHLFSLANPIKSAAVPEFHSAENNKFRNGLLTIADPAKSKKEGSVGSESNVSEECSSSESDTESTYKSDKKPLLKVNDMFSHHRQGSPKQASVCPATTPLPSGEGISAYVSPRTSPSGSYDNEMPYDLSSNKRLSATKEAVLPERNASLNGEVNSCEQPLDLRVKMKRKRNPSSVHISSDDDLKHKTHIFGDTQKSEGSRTPTTPTSPSTPNSFHQVDSTSPSPISPSKFPLNYHRAINPFLYDPMYRLPTKYNFQNTSDRYGQQFQAPRFPFNMIPSNHTTSAYEFMKSQMERMSKQPYPELLSPHMTKSKERYTCKFCGKVFPRSANLTRHLRTHTGEQPYRCQYCERSFSISSNLQRHVRNIHNKEKPFKCHLCERCFGQQTNLDRHLKKHESDGPTIMDSPKATEHDDSNKKDEAYFDDIRNFMGKVTNMNAHHPAAHYLHSAFPEHVKHHRSTSLTPEQPSPQNASISEDDCQEAEPLPKKIKLDNESGSDDKDVDLERSSSTGSEAPQMTSLKKRLDFRYQNDSDENAEDDL